MKGPLEGLRLASQELFGNNGEGLADFEEKMQVGKWDFPQERA